MVPYNIKRVHLHILIDERLNPTLVVYITLNPKVLKDEKTRRFYLQILLVH